MSVCGWCRCTTRRCAPSLLDRRRWEQRIAAVLREQREGEVDTAAQRYERIYKRRQFVPVEVAFPLLDHARWHDVVPTTSTGAAADGTTTTATTTTTPAAAAAAAAVVQQPANAHVLRAAFLGPQNAGKTSLVNALALGHVGAVSNRHGSTQTWTRAVATVHHTQLQLYDTPGLVRVRGAADRQRRHAATAAVRAWDALYAADLAVLTLPVGLGFVEAEHKHVAREVVQRASARELPVVLVMTMLDKVQTPRHRELYFALRTDLESLGLPFAASHEVSVKGVSGLVELKDCLCRYAVPGRWSYARHVASDWSPVEHVAELLRQTYLEVLPHEVPHTMRQRIIGWTRKDSGTTEVVVEVFFDRPAYLFTFYAKLEAVCVRAQTLVEAALHARYRFVFQAFISPNGMAKA